MEELKVITEPTWGNEKVFHKYVSYKGFLYQLVYDASNRSVVCRVKLPTNEFKFVLSHSDIEYRIHGMGMDKDTLIEYAKEVFNLFEDKIKQLF